MKFYFGILFFLVMLALMFQNSAKAATLGNTTPGTLSGASPNILAATKFTMPNENGTLASLSAYFTSAAAAPNNLFQLAVYTDSANVPGALIASSATQAITANAWNTVAISGNLTANATYWLAINANGASAVAYNATAVNTSYYHGQAFGTMPNPFGVATASATSISIYATYTPAGGTPDTTPPTVSISAPTNGATVSGSSVTLTADASDNIGVAGVQFRLDGTNLGPEDTSAPYSTTWNTTTVSNGAHSITAVARDTSNNTTTSAAVSITVSNTVPPPPPPPPPGSWTPPIGIPAPEFGINETVESLHGGNSNFRTQTVSGGGSLNTLMPSLVPGDVLVIESGTYTVTGGTTWNHAGTATNPIIVRGTSSTSKPIIRVISSSNNLHLSGSYVIYENLDFDISSLGDTGVDMSGHHISFRDSEIRNGIGTTHSALFLGGTYNVAYRNKIHDNGPLGAAGDIDFHGMGAGGDHHWIVDNEIYRNAGDGIQLNPGNAANARGLHHIYVGRNDAWGNQQTGFWIKFSEDIIFSQNKSHGHRPSDSSSGQGMGSQYGTERAWFLYNEIYDNIQGIFVASDGGPGGNGNGQDQYFVGNVIRNNSSVGFVAWETSARKHAVNNTVYGSATGLDWFNAKAGTEVMNNIFANISGTDMDLASNGGGTFSNNLCDTACAMVSATCSSCFAGSAAFVDVDGANNIAGDADDNLQILSNSTAIDRGVVSSVYSTFQSLYGFSIAVDHDGNGRPVGSAWDIGAYEYNSGGTPPPPPPPSTYQRTINITALEGRTSRVISGTLEVLNSSKVLITSYPFTTNTSGSATITFNIPTQTVYLKTNATPFLDRVIQVDLNNNVTYNFPQLLTGDIDGNNIINSIDYSTLNTNWFTANASGDLDQNGIVNSIDFSYMNIHWLASGEV